MGAPPREAGAHGVPRAPGAPDAGAEVEAPRAKVTSALIVVAAALFAFSSAFSFPFLTWDDTDNITFNPLVRGGGDGVWTRIWSEPYAGLYVPLSYSVWRVLALVSGPAAADGSLVPDAALFHGANLALHALSAWLVLRLLRRLVAHEGAAVVGALFFALHPLQTESVVWVSELRGLLASALGLFALERHLARDGARHGARDGSATRVAPLVNELVALLAFAAALLAKPSAVVFPLFALLLERFWLRRPWRSVLPAAAVGGALALGAVLLAQSAQSEKLGELTPWLQRPRIALDALAFYLEKLAWPSGLAPDHGRTSARVLADSAGAWQLAIPLAVVGALALARARRELWVAAAVFLAGLLPVLGLVPFAFQRISNVADRYAYLALLGPALALALLARTRSHLAALACGFAVTLAGALGWRQTQVWRDTRALFEHTLEVNPASYKAWSHIGLALGNEGKDDEAIRAYERCLELEPEHQVAHFNLACILQRRGRAAEALPHFEAASRLKASDTTAHKSYAIALLNVQRTAEARALLEQVALREPGDAAVHYSLATAWLLDQELDRAEAELERAVALHAEPEYQRTLGVVRNAQGDAANAIAPLRAAIAARPEWIEPLCDLASILGASADETLRRPDEALALARRAVELSRGEDVRALEVLAALHARAGRMSDAIRVQQQAVTRAQASAPELVSGTQETLRSYRASADAAQTPR